ncbi:hypothetical protein I549_6156 [Mycobacterium avium subsp. avium 2285 (R)]|nr:hypothetical protein I549_6156 [Mycobacterium avium subsp. avium 2285 (R)]
MSEAAEVIRAKIDEQVEASAEVAQVVASLERQYDAFIDAQENRSLLTRDAGPAQRRRAGRRVRAIPGPAGGEEVRRRRRPGLTRPPSHHRRHPGPTTRLAI